MENTFKALPVIVPHHHGCLCCVGAEITLEMDTVLYNGFGGWSVTKDGDLFYEASPNGEWSDFSKLSDIEKYAAKSPNSDWRAICNTPLHGETYQRQNGIWFLVEQNEGFA